MINREKTHSYKVAGSRISFAIYIPMYFKIDITKMALSKISEALSQPLETIFIPSSKFLIGH